MRILSRQSCILGAILFVAGCSAADVVGDLPGLGGEGGSEDPGGSATGGSTKNTGGTIKGGSGGSGQNTGTGGKGGIASGTGGSSEKGGSDGTGGRTTGKGGGGDATGGRDGKGGSPGTGGKFLGIGGGSPGTGGKAIGTGGAGGRSGTPGTGGAGPGTGGNMTGPGTGGTTVTESCSEADKALSGNGTGKHCGYTYEYWKDSGSGTLTLKKDGFSVDWSGINNLLGRKGIRPGTGKEVVNYDANYQPNGNSYLCIYGWFKGPLVEYYIVDSWGSWRPPGGQGLQGTVTCDGGTYDIYKVPRTGPSIEGDNTSFTQYWSVRQQKKTSGTITVGCHFDAWKAKGMSIGSFYEVSMTVEGYQSSGKADVKFSMK